MATANHALDSTNAGEQKDERPNTHNAKKVTQHSSARDDFETHRVSENAEIPHFCGISGAKVGDTGFEPVTSTV